MLEVVLALGLGLGIGRLGRASNRVKRASGLLSGWGIVALLFCMGVSIGGNPQVLQDLPVMGGKALLLALGGAGGAFLCGLPIAWWLRKTSYDADLSEERS